ncbi:hypothetical protein L7F22_005384 [Adiantum nelumboides]|nr:hypothetical protein [Adiantum nelumboides]
MLMYGALEQDFDELQAEAAEVAALLQKAKVNKLRLQTEIKFLKKRASMLRASMRIPDPYLSREAVGEGAQYIFGPSRASAGRMVLGDLQSKSLHPQSSNLSSRMPSNLVSSFKRQDVVGALKSPSKQEGLTCVVQPKRVGKRKISWQDEFSARG